MRVLGVIPARGGSKGIPQKNLASLAGRPLIAYTCEAAARSAELDRVIVSTDGPDIAAEAKKWGVEAPFLRPSRLAADDVPMLPVLLHALTALRELDGYEADAVALLQPTSPLRTSARVDEAVRLFVQTGADSVVSVVEVPHHFNPVSLLRVVDGRLQPFVSGPPILQRQEKPRLLARNGPAVLVTRRRVLEGDSLYGDDSRPLVMRPEESVDIDTPLDLELAELLLARRESPYSRAAERT